MKQRRFGLTWDKSQWLHLISSRGNAEVSHDRFYAGCCVADSCWKATCRLTISCQSYDANAMHSSNGSSTEANLDGTLCDIKLRRNLSPPTKV
jgi:hypothetical protein